MKNHIQITLPTRIVVPAGSNLNALFDFLFKATALDSVFACSPAVKVEDTSLSRYSGDSTHFALPSALPKVEPFDGKIYANETDAQEAKDEIVRAEIAKDAAKAQPVPTALA